MEVGRLRMIGGSTQRGWASTYDGEYVALALLQADASVTLDADLDRAVTGIVTTASLEAPHPA
jgi:hypothetical protein